MSPSTLHPIQVAARRSGLSAERIRAWERRYQVVTPLRSETHRRFYRDEDIERLRLLAQATKAGRRIGDIAALDNSELLELLEADDQAMEQAPTPSLGRPSTESVMDYFEQCLNAISSLQPSRLYHLLHLAEIQLAEPFMQEDLIIPLVQHLQRECRQGHLRLAQQRMAHNVIRNRLQHYAIHSDDPLNPTPGAIVTGMTSQEDELPLLRLCVAIRAYGWNPIYLGHDIAPDEITFAAQRAKAGCTAIAAGLKEDDLLPNELRKLLAITPPDHPVLLYDPNRFYVTLGNENNITLLETYGALRLALAHCTLDHSDDDA